MPNYNPAGVDLAVAALAQIEMHPETWEQGEYRCQTGMCLAGWMAELSPEVQWRNSYADDARLMSGQFVSEWAVNIIGLGPYADGLFAGTNTIEDLRAGVKALCNGESVVEAIERDRDERAS